jgi:cytoskeleton protein RodZ
MESMTTENKNTAGELLKQGRLRQRLSIAECAKRTHVSSRYLEALEEEKWGILPSESHRLGFMKLYSKFLGVPTEEVLTLYRQATAAPTAA